jgi:hypothetical protein
MNDEPRQQDEYSARQVEAARRVLVDVGQVLAGFQDCVVLVGGWVPDLLIPVAEEPHTGSIDVDFAIDARKLRKGRYAEMLGLLLKTKRYYPGPQSFQLMTDVEMEDGAGVIRVELDFLAPKNVRMDKNRPKLLENFRVLQAVGCEVAFRAPVAVQVSGQMVKGASNTVTVQVASVADMLVMKALALRGRDKPKDAYDLCYCLRYAPGGVGALARDWRQRASDKHVCTAREILREKFAGPDSFGPMQVVEFRSASSADERAIDARTAFEIVQSFLDLL